MAKPEEREIERKISEALNDTKFLNLTTEDNDKIIDLINEYLGEEIESDDEDLTPEEVADFDNDDGDSEDEIDPDNFGVFDDQVPMNPGVDSDDDGEGTYPIFEPGNDVILANGDPEFMSEDDEKEMELIRNRRCRCRQPHQGLGCTHKFTPEFVFKTRLQVGALSSQQKMMFLLGKVSTSGVRSGDMTETTKQVQKNRKRKRSKMGYHVDGLRVCRDAFCFIYKVSDKYITKLMRHYVENGIEVMEKKSGGSKQNTRCFSLEDVQRAVTFVNNYAEEKALTIPGRVPTVKTTDARTRLLPASENRTSLWRKYRKSLLELNALYNTEHRVMGITTFVKVWKRHLPFVLTTKPRTDLCWDCQRHSQKIYLASNLSVQTKRELLDEHIEHLRVVDLERRLYQEDIAASRNAITTTPANLGRHAPCSREGSMHYSFDFAQQVCYPHDPEQPGPVYFLVERKCGIFGIHCEGLSRQMNFLIDEGMAESKGPNAVISYLHFYFANYSLGERIAYLHCDNCSGQNKNKYVMWYLLWRTMTGLHDQIHLRFLIAGHTKFAPDWCFGLLKQRYNKCHVSCLSDLADVVSSSTHTNVNVPCIVGTEDGHVNVPTYNWKEFLEPYFKPVTGIKKMHHLSMNKQFPGEICTKEYADSPSVKGNFVKGTAVPSGMPDLIPPPGLSLKRQWYLYSNIRPYCAQDERADRTCPLPLEELE